jgi:ribonuclease HI
MNLYVDGGTKPGGIYWSVADDTDVMARCTSNLYRTNQEAEYQALIWGLDLAAFLKGPVTIHSDSRLVVNQFNGQWKVKAAHLRPLLKRAREAAEELDVEVVWVPRMEILRRLGH